MKLKFKSHHLQPSVLEARFRGYLFQLFYEEGKYHPYLMDISFNNVGIEKHSYLTRQKAIEDALPLLYRYLDRERTTVFNYITKG